MTDESITYPAPSEVRIVTPDGTYHRGYLDSHGNLYTCEADNLDQSEGRVVTAYTPEADWTTATDMRSLPPGIDLKHCHRCFPE